MSYSNGPKSITNGLVLYLDAANPKSYISGSNTWYDLSGNNLSGSLTNGPTYNSANKGSIVFDGIDDYVSIPYDAKFNLINLSICGWIYISSTDVGGDILNKYVSGGFNGYRLSANSGSGVGLYYFYDYYQGLSQHDEKSGTLLNNSWNHVCCTINSSGAVLYLNSNSVGTRSWVGGVSGSITSTQEISIGKYPILPSSGIYLKGRLSTVQLYNRALSAQEILQNYNSTKGRFGL